jgi:hypothetical protein
VHWAQDATDANAIALQIAQRVNARPHHQRQVDGERGNWFQPCHGGRWH